MIWFENKSIRCQWVWIGSDVECCGSNQLDEKKLEIYR